VHFLPDVDWRRGLAWMHMSAGLIVAAAAVAGLWVMSTGPAALVRVPDFTGLRAEVAAAVAGDHGLHSKEVRVVHGGPAGTVIVQNPKVGSFLKRGSTVTLAITTGARQVVVPQVASMPLDQARDVLTKAGLSVGAVVFRQYPDREPGRVISTKPAPGGRVDQGTAVDVVVPLPPR
jgi:serine/threonine-protein kinase